MASKALRRYGLFAPLVGALITVMNGVNSGFSEITGNVIAVLVIHLAGLFAVSVVLLFRKEGGASGRLPIYYYLGGFIGVGTVFACTYAYSTLGATLAVALALLGQTLFSIAADATGMLGREKHALSVRRIPGIALALAGIAIMAAGTWRTTALAIFAALMGGAIPGLSFVLNSELGRKLGVFRSTRVNYLVGLATILVIVAIMRPELGPAAESVLRAGPLLALGGGFMGVAVVTAMNLIVPKMPVFSATILLFVGQTAAGLLVDLAVKGSLDAKKLIGTAVLVAGLALDTILSRSEKKA
jgi:bacterial/archaeal transporter family-2 protein